METLLTEGMLTSVGAPERAVTQATSSDVNNFRDPEKTSETPVAKKTSTALGKAAKAEPLQDIQGRQQE